MSALCFKIKSVIHGALGTAGSSKNHLTRVLQMPHNAGMEFINASTLPSPAGHYSHAVVSMGFVFVSGVLPDAATINGPDSFDQQLASVLDRCELALVASGCTLHDVVQCNAYIVGIENWPKFNVLYAQRMGLHKPARAVVPVPQLHYGALVEIQLTAQRPVSSK